MLTIRNDHVDNHLNDKFIHLYRIDYFINNNKQKLIMRYIYRTFYIFRNKILYKDIFISKFHREK